MFRTKIVNLIYILCGIQFSIAQDDSFLTIPWIDVVQAPDANPVIIAINSSCVTPVPNTLNRFISSSNKETYYMFNTGKSLYVRLFNTTSPYSSYTMGGALGLDEYRFYAAVFLWDLNLGNAGVTVDGVGYSLQILKFHWNIKYVPQHAANYRDGWYAQVIPAKIVDGAPYSDAFATFAQKINKIRQPGTNVMITPDDGDWYKPSSIRLQEYCYPGSVRTLTVNEVTNSATICITLDDDLATISQAQFLDIFGRLLNEDGESFSDVRPLQNASPDTPISSFGPIVGSSQLE